MLYTDGVIEAPGREGRFGLPRLHALLADHAGSSPQALLDHLERALAEFSGAPARDDVAALALRTET